MPGPLRSFSRRQGLGRLASSLTRTSATPGFSGAYDQASRDWSATFICSTTSVFSRLAGDTGMAPDLFRPIDVRCLLWSAAWHPGVAPAVSSDEVRLWLWPHVCHDTGRGF